MQRFVGGSVLVAMLAIGATLMPGAVAEDKNDASEEARRMDAAATVLNEVMGTPDKGIPQEVLESA